MTMEHAHEKQEIDDFSIELWRDFEAGDIDALDDLDPVDIALILQHPLNRHLIDEVVDAVTV